MDDPIEVACPACRAPAGYRCNIKGGNPGSAEAHVQRFAAFNEAEREERYRDTSRRVWLHTHDAGQLHTHKVTRS